MRAPKTITPIATQRMAEFERRSIAVAANAASSRGASEKREELIWGASRDWLDRGVECEKYLLVDGDSVDPTWPALWRGRGAEGGTVARHSPATEQPRLWRARKRGRRR